MRVPAPINRAETLWRRGVFESYSLGEHVQAALCPGEKPRIFPAYALEFIAECSEFKPMRKHLLGYAEKHGWDSLQVEALEKLLPELQEARLLVSAPEVIARMTAPSSEETPEPIRFIGLPTGGNRVALLERAIRSFSENFRQHEQRVDLLVSDSSERPEHAAAFVERLSSLQTELGVSILYAGQKEKRHFADALAKAGACSFETAEFALLDPLGTGFACGANRNALLLHGAGELFCSVDDDVVCRLAGLPDQSAGRSFFSNGDPFSRWLFADRESAYEAAAWLEASFIDGHAKMLGHHVSNLVGGLTPEQCDFSGCGESFLKRAASGRGR
ncbi:MAG: hypothetical protein EOP84_28095, partial [Verrucomicrobiaceae bacterium]